MKLRLLLAGILATITWLPAYCQGTPPQQSKDISTPYIFTPETVYPLGMRPRPVTTYFALTITSDSVTCHLPYIGKAYSSDYGSAPGVINFSSADFSHQGQEEATHSAILIIPKDNTDVKTIRITYYKEEEGYANVRGIFNQRQGIEYRGKLNIRH